MVEDEGPNHGRSRHGEERCSSLEQRPRLRHLVVFHGRNRFPGSGDVPIKQVEDLLRETPAEVDALLTRYARVVGGLDDGRTSWRKLKALNQLGVTRGSLQML